MKRICNVLSNDDGSLQFPPAMGQSANPDLANVNRGGIMRIDGPHADAWKNKQVAKQAREHAESQHNRMYELMVRVIDQAAKVRTLQKQWYKSIKDEKRDYDVLAESKAAEKELDALLEEYNSPQERML